MAESAEAVYALADLLEHLGAPWSLPEDWIILCDNDDLHHMPRAAAKRLLAKAKKETARRSLSGRFDPTEMELELSEESEGGDGSEISDDRALKQRAINSIDDVVSTIESLRGLYANRPIDRSQKSAHEATVAARLQFCYPADPPSQTDCFDEDVARQCHRIINEIYSPQAKSSGSLVYLISTENPGFVKIGFTTSLEGRLKALRTASHVEPTVHLTLSGTVSLERQLHKRFEAARHSREWFRMTEEIKAFIAMERES